MLEIFWRLNDLILSCVLCKCFLYHVYYIPCFAIHFLRIICRVQSSKLQAVTTFCQHPIVLVHFPMTSSSSKSTSRITQQPSTMPSDTPMPSSFDNDRYFVRCALIITTLTRSRDFYEENRLQKLTRRLKEEPLIPFGEHTIMLHFTDRRQQLS